MKHIVWFLSGCVVVAAIILAVWGLGKAGKYGVLVIPAAGLSIGAYGIGRAFWPGERIAHWGRKE